MSRRSDIAFIVCLSAVFAGGCADVAATRGSPLGSFEKAVARIKAKLPDKDISFDVQQTESLVTPYVAYVSFRRYEPSEVADLRYLAVVKVVGEYVFQDGKWACKQVVLKVDGVEFVSGNRAFFADVAASYGRDIGRVLRAWKGVELESAVDLMVSALRDAP